MDNSEVIEKFESVLKCHNTEKTLNLYSNIGLDNYSKCDVRPQDVIANLTQQLNTLQRADVIKNVPIINRTIEFKDKSKKTDFVSVNMLQSDNRSCCQPSTSKFETQCVTDTQLLDLVEKAEMHIEEGMTQEFNSSFKNEDSNNITFDKNDTRIVDDSFEDKNDKDEHKCVILNDDKLDGINDVRYKDYVKTEIENTNISMIPNCSDTKNDDLTVNDEDIELPLSPVFKSAKFSQNKLKGPLVYELESFEKFESIAVPIVEDIVDNRTATKIINSQIVDRILFLNLHNDPLLIERDKQSSPIINLENDKFAFVKDICDQVKGRITPDKRSDDLKEELLFSSDEEDDCLQELTPKLDFALLETHSNDSDDFDKSMYVGFQTASNKSIQICTDSFQKAKIVLSNVETSNKKTTDNNDCKSSQEKIKVNELSANVILETSGKRKYEGFKTASNKKIKLSKKALSRCSKVFQDIDINECYDKNDECLIAVEPEINLSKIEDDDLIKEFDNIEMSHEDSEDTSLKVEDLENKAEGIDVKSMEDTDKLTNINLNKLSNPIFCSFKTASTKEVKISDSALARSKAIFEEFDTENVVQNQDLSTAKENDFSESEFSDKSQCEANNANNAKILEETVNNSLNKLVDSTNPLVFKGFQTASNKEINISKQALEKYKKILQDIENCDDENMTSFNDEAFENFYNSEIQNGKESKDSAHNFLNHNSKNNNIKFEGFKTASNKDVVVSREAIAKSKMWSSDIHYLESDLPKSISEFQEFQTVHNNTDALEKIEDIFQDTFMETKNMNIITELKGFQTANNKNVHISDAALESSKKMFRDLECDNVAQFTKRVSKPALTFQGFQTASNKKVSVSKEAFQHTKSIFHDIDITDNLNEHKESSTNFKDFQTARNKKVESDNVTQFTKYIAKPVSKFQGFQTASNKTVSVSKEALKHTKSIFHDIDFSDNLNEHKESRTIFEGFQAASNKKVKVSHDAIEKSKKMLEDLGNCELSNLINESKDLRLKGFLTAADKTVVVSEQTLAKSKKIFDEISEYTEKNILRKPDGTTKYLQDKVKETLGIKIKYNRNSRILEEALKKPQNLQETDTTENYVLEKKVKPNQKAADILRNMETELDTQILNNFDEPLCTEDFDRTPRAKRSGSPIISCPKAKKRKIFTTPHKSNLKANLNIVEKNPKKEPLFNFDPNYKKHKKYTLKDIAKLDKNSTKSNNFCLNLQNIDFENLSKFEFEGERNDLTNEKLTSENFMNMFIESSDKKIIPNGWIENHMKLILWKLISYEIKFPSTMKGVCTARNVIEQLRFRYRKELYNAERPALRKIFEKDETSAKTLVLCVAAMYVDNVQVNSVTSTSTNIELLLTDGWYTIMATLDKMLADLVVKDKIKVGTKLAVCGAELMNCEQGVAPWENTSAIRLKLFGNSTRRARWDSRLGFHGNSAILSPLSSVKLDGGKISKLKVFITRVYPMLYVEKFEDGSTVTRSERLENLHQIKYENDRQALMEKIYEEVEKEFSSQSESQDSDPGHQTNEQRMETGSQIAKIMKKCNDPAEFRSHLTSSQLKLLQEHSTKRREEYLQTVQSRVLEKLAAVGDVARKVTSLVKIRVAGVAERDGRVDVKRAMLSIWRPNDGMMEILTEGSWIEVLNVVPTSFRYSELQISAGRQSIFRESKQKHSEKVDQHTNLLKRKCYDIKDLIQHLTSNNEFDEIDTYGMVFLIEPSIKEFDSTKQSFQNVYLTDADKNLISINFWGGIKKFGYENMLDIGQIIACVNLQKRAGNTRKNMSQYRVTELTYLTKTPKDSVARSMVEILEKKFLGVDRIKFSEDCVSLKNNYSMIKHYNADHISPYRLNNSDYNISKNKVFIDSPLISKPNKADENLNLTGLDFESSFKQTNSGELSPNSLLRKKKVQERIDKLKRYGEPPPISPITIINKSKNATSSYISPFPNVNVTTSVANVKEKLLNNSPKTTIENSDEDLQSSPIIAMNKTYVKRSINPVKLNFSNSIAIKENDSGMIDQFAEEFETSPPLSLD